MFRARVAGAFVGSVLLLTVAGWLLAPVSASARPAAGGLWAGKWDRAANEIDPAGPTAFTIHQVGNNLNGTYGWRGCTSKKGAVFVGYAQGNAAVLAVRQTDGTLITEHMTLADNHASISGRFDVIAGTCQGTSGPFDAKRIGH